MDMTLYYSHRHRAAKRAEREKVLQHLVPDKKRVQMRVQETISENSVVRELVYNDELTASQ